MIHINRLRRLLLISAALPGCAAGPGPSAERDAKGVDHADVVLSVSHDLPPSIYVRAFFHFDEGLLLDKGFLETPYRALTSDFTDRRGRIIVLSLLPGRHTFDTWHYETSIGAWHPKHRPELLTFDVAAGETIYIGNLHLRFGTEATSLNPRNTPGLTALVQDRSDEDIPAAERLRPDLRGRITVRTLPLGPWISKNLSANRTESNSSRATSALKPSCAADTRAGCSPNGA